MPKKKTTPSEDCEQTVSDSPKELAEKREDLKAVAKKPGKSKNPSPEVEADTASETAEGIDVAVSALQGEFASTYSIPEGALPEVCEEQILPNERRLFFGQDFNELDRYLTAEERQEWNSIYASYRGRSALSGTIIGVDRHTVALRNKDTGEKEQQSMCCAIVIPYRVRIVIPATEMWETSEERPTFVLQNMVGATISFIITMVDRENGFAIASRRQAMRNERWFFSRRPSLSLPGAHLTCRLLSVGPRRCLVECHGHDIDLTQRELRYAAIPDLRDEYHPGQELECVVKAYDPMREMLKISVKETESNPFEGAAYRHPEGCRRQAVISGKYGGGVFCNLPDGTVCMCSYSYQHTDSEFKVGDTVILVVQRYNFEKKQMYGKIISKW